MSPFENCNLSSSSFASGTFQASTLCLYNRYNRGFIKPVVSLYYSGVKGSNSPLMLTSAPLAPLSSPRVKSISFSDPSTLIPRGEKSYFAILKHLSPEDRLGTLTTLVLLPLHFFFYLNVPSVKYQ